METTTKTKKIWVCQSGHRCQGTDDKGNPACVICIGLSGYSVKEIDFDFTGRKAYCTCGKEVDSSPNLAFFEIGGCIKRAPEELLQAYRLAQKAFSECLDRRLPRSLTQIRDIYHGAKEIQGYYNRAKSLHDAQNQAEAICREKAPDAFYCGCQGWD